MPRETVLMLTLACSPEQCLSLQGEAASAVEKALQAAWQQGEPAGVVWLATEGLAAPLDASIGWLRGWAQRFLARLCQTRDASAVEIPAEALNEMVSSAPPFLGAEYVTEGLPARLWEELRAHVQAEAGDDLDGWLQKRGELWHQVGRVTFHVAENPRDAARPFAFLATFTERLSAGGRLQHLPLGRALQRYAEQKDHAALNNLLGPVRAAAEKSPAVQRLLESRQLFQALAWSPAEAYELVRDLALLRECGIVVKVPDWWKSGRPPRPMVQVTLDVPKDSKVGTAAMLAFSVNVSMGGEPLTAEEIAKIKASSSGLVSLRGQWAEVNREQLDQMLLHWTKVQHAHMASGLSFHEGMRYLSGFGTPGLAGGPAGYDGQRGAWAEVIAGKNLGSLLSRLREPASEPPPMELRTELRPYQREGLAWLRLMQSLGLGACLADDMGLGKTVQVIALLLALKQEAPRAPSLIVAPASLLGNWRAELGKFAPTLRVFTAHASGTGREDLAALERGPGKVLEGVDAVLTTYQFITSSAGLRPFHWDLVVLDEAQAIKTPGAAQTQAVKKLQSRARIALTGTPVENRPGDLWSLFDFLNPGLLGSATAFAETLSRLGSGTGFAPLRRLVRPYILRRMKTDRRIIRDLPDKTEMVSRCPLTRRQATLYTRLVEELKKALADESLPPIKRNGQVLGFLLKFKQVCDHPSLWNGDGQYRPEDSGKFARLTEICTELAERQQRLIVFTQFAEMCEPLAHHLKEVFGRPGLVLHGGTPVKQRAGLVERFQAADGPPFFVISVKAGGTGLNLTAASHVIHFDRWWNPAVENQATDRAYRIGQRKNVLVHKFLVPGTIEERVDRLMQEKRVLAEDLLGTGTGAEKLITGMSNEELMRLVSLDLGSVEG